MLACSWKDLLRVQFWIGAVIVLGKIALHLHMVTQEDSTGNFPSLLKCFGILNIIGQGDSLYTVHIHDFMTPPGPNIYLFLFCNVTN